MVRHRHQACRFAIAFRPGHSEIVFKPAVGVGTLLVTDHTDAFTAEAAEATDDGCIVAMLTIAGQWDEFADQSRHVIEAMRPLRMACDLRLLPWRQPAVEFFQSDRGLVFDATDFFADCDGIAAALQRA